MCFCRSGKVGKRERQIRLIANRAHAVICRECLRVWANILSDVRPTLRPHFTFFTDMFSSALFCKYDAIYCEHRQNSLNILQTYI